MRGKTGAVRMALDANMPLIPAAHWGTQVLMPRYSGKIRLFPRSPIQVLIGKPLDMSYAALRAVSPVHLQYMRNMGTGASMSVSLIAVFIPIFFMPGVIGMKAKNQSMG